MFRDNFAYMLYYAEYTGIMCIFMKLLDKVRTKIKFKHYSKSTETNYVLWIKQFILYHNKRHPNEMGKFEIEQFLSYLATHRKVSASTQNQAFNALMFLYNQVLELPLVEKILGSRYWGQYPF